MGQGRRGSIPNRVPNFCPHLATMWLRRWCYLLLHRPKVNKGQVEDEVHHNHPTKRQPEMQNSVGQLSGSPSCSDTNGSTRMLILYVQMDSSRQKEV